MMILPLSILLGAFLASAWGSDFWDSLDICHLSACTPHMDNVTVLEKFCDGNPLGPTYMDGRCCMKHPMVNGEEEHFIVGLDLSMCALKSLGGLMDLQESVLDRSRLQILVVNENPLENCSAAYFSGMSSLHYLSLPSDCGCPGGDSAWFNVTAVANSSVCSGLRNICRSDNVTCPKNSHCELHSPGSTWCSCDAGYYGYKCLRSGGFHSEMFGFLLAGGTVFLSALCWFLLRRHVINLEVKEIKSQ